MYALAARLDPDSYLSLARAVFAEMVQAGYTVVGEFHYLHHDQHGRPYADPNAMGRALIQAATEAGVRLTLIDACYLAGKTNVHGSIFQFEGMATVFAPNQGPCYRCLYPTPPPPGLVPS